MGLTCDHNVDDEPGVHMIEFALEATSIDDFEILDSVDDNANLREDIVTKPKVCRPVKEMIEFFEHVDKSTEFDFIKAQLFNNEFYNSWRRSTNSLGTPWEGRHVGQ